MRRLAIIAAALVLNVFTGDITRAHVVVSDISSSQTAVLHIMPDDDPIAGETSIVYFDLQSTNNGNARSVELLVERDSFREKVVMDVKDSLATGSTVFPEQGVYKLVFQVTYADSKATYAVTQRVTRGVAGDSANSPQHTWAEAVLIVSGLSLLSLGVIAWNRRSFIADVSK
jgi:hypothetical protein